MNSNEIESNVKRIFENFSKEEFPFDLLLAYGISKTSITRCSSENKKACKSMICRLLKLFESLSVTALEVKLMPENQ